MRDGLKRRDLIRGAVAAGAMLALPALARGSGPSLDFERAFDILPDPVPPAMVPAAPTELDYTRKLIAIARRESARTASLVNRRDYVAIADFARPSSLPRLHVVNLDAGTVQGYLVAHGRGSDPEHDGWLKNFSNAVGSEATSRGAYIVGDSFAGKYGAELRLHGLDPDNSNAYDRAIVMHPAWYAAPDMLAKWGKLGRSEGLLRHGPRPLPRSLRRACRRAPAVCGPHRRGVRFAKRRRQ